jgi:magnesium transporter
LTILAVFLPVVAGQGGNAGAQSLAVVMRGIVMREIPRDKIYALVRKEGKIGAINGAVIGAVTALVAWIWYGNPFLGLVIGLGMLVNLILAGLAGASIPLIMKKIGIDPAQGCGPCCDKAPPGACGTTYTEHSGIHFPSRRTHPNYA